MISDLKKKLVGDRKFYKMVLAITVPIMVQNGITNFVNLLDNIMVGQVGTGQMSGVAIVNQLIFVFNLTIFGGLSGAGIFTAQYYGQKDDEGIRHTFRYKIWTGLIVLIAAFAIFLSSGDRLIGLYLNGSNTELEVALEHGLRYLHIAMIGLPAFMICQVYAGTLRACGETVITMKAGVTAVLVNLVFNYLLIYGKFGFPKMGVAGAALATVLSRYIELLIVVTWTHRHADRQTYVKGLYRTLKVPMHLVKKFTIKGLPLLFNECLWSVSVAFLSQCYSVRGLDAVAAQNISQTIGNVFSIGFMAMGDAVAIIVGQLLGAGKMKEARDTDTKIIAFAVFLGVCLGGTMFIIAPMFPRLYNTTPEVRRLACDFIMIQSLFMPEFAFLHSAYFTLRSGGKTVITFFFDSVYITLVSVPIAFVLSRYTNLHVLTIFTVIQAVDLVKCAVGFVLVKKGVWIQNIVSD